MKTTFFYLLIQQKVCMVCTVPGPNVSRVSRCILGGEMRNMRCSVRLSLGVMLFAFCMFGAGCTTQLNLTMKKDIPLVDHSVISPKLQEKKITRIIIIPPAGTPRSDLESKIILFEREFLKKGITVISGDITGRVVMESLDKPDEKKVEAARSLSEMERALTMANSTGADAILQLIEFRWLFPQAMTRYFVGELEDEGEFREVTYDEWHAWSGMKRDFLSPKWIFVGRVVDVNSGEVLASYDLSMPANFTLPEDYQARYLYTPVENRLTKSKLIGEYTFSYDGNSWLPRAMERAENKVMAHIAASIATTSVVTPAGTSSTAGMKVSAEKSPEKSPEKIPEKLSGTTSLNRAEAGDSLGNPRPAMVKKFYAIQIKALQDVTEAKKFAEEVRKKHPDVQWVETNIKGRGIWYRIFIGGFCTKSEAIRYRNEKKIRKLFPDSFIQTITVPPNRPIP